MLRWALVAAVAASTAALAGCGSQESARTSTRLTDLTSVDQLRRDFEKHEGRPQLLLLFSPT